MMRAGMQLVSMKREELDLLCNGQLLKRDSTLWTYFMHLPQ